jgi:hypothetical protein
MRRRTAFDCYVEWLKTKYKKWRYQKKLDAAMKRFGWDATCGCCGQWFHGDDSAKCVGSTDMHWFYRCNCGRLNVMLLGFAPCPIHNDPHQDGTPDWHEELELLPDDKRAAILGT